MNNIVPTPHELKIYQVQRGRFCTMLNTSPTTEFTKDFLLSIVNGEPASIITFNNTSIPITFTMIFLARQILSFDHHVYI